MFGFGSMHSANAGCGRLWPSQGFGSFLFNCWHHPSLETLEMQSRRFCDLERRTLVCPDGGGLPIPSKQFWYEHAVQILWWDLDLLYQTEVQKGIWKTSKSKWSFNFQNRIAASLPALGPGDLPYVIRENLDDMVIIGTLCDFCQILLFLCTYIRLTSVTDLQWVRLLCDFSWKPQSSFWAVPFQLFGTFHTHFVHISYTFGTHFIQIKLIIAYTFRTNFVHISYTFRGLALPLNCKKNEISKHIAFFVFLGPGGQFWRASRTPSKIVPKLSETQKRLCF